ncbi:MAG: tetratricopeptide repeat protein [Ignavibacteriaceae bacterium]
MLAKNYFIVSILLISLIDIFPQYLSSEEEAIKQVIMNETKGWAYRNYDGMVENWAHENYVIKMSAGPNFYEEVSGWNSINDSIKIDLKNYTQKVDVSWSDWNIHSYNNCAWASYLQSAKVTGSSDEPYKTREVRFLEKKNGFWKIVFLSTVNVSSYKSYHDYWAKLENDINDAGYKLLNEKKYEDAIDIFKKNVKLYPESSNVYDSLGEAYMMNGDKELAIENYKRSLELNPENTNAIKMLKKLAEM